MKAFDRLWPVDDVRIVTVSLKYPSDFLYHSDTLTDSYSFDPAVKKYAIFIRIALKPCQEKLRYYVPL